jgi:hypothetical protein
MATSKYQLSGGCHCGSVRYTMLEPPQSIQHCHCESCRKVSGCFYQTAGVVRRDKVIIDGSDHLTKYRSSESFERQFCRTCGCALFGYDEDDVIRFYVHLPTLDGGVNPGHPKDMESHTYMGERAEWEFVSDELPHFEKEGPGEIITTIQRGES